MSNNGSQWDLYVDINNTIFTRYALTTVKRFKLKFVLIEPVLVWLGLPEWWSTGLSALKLGRSCLQDQATICVL